MPPSTDQRGPSPDDCLDLVFHALSHRTRRALLRQLTTGPAKITELAEPFAMSLPAVSKHLRVLERAGLVQRSVEGRVHRCSFGAAPLEEVEAWLDGTRAFWEGRLAGLAAYVESGADKRTKRRTKR